MMMGFLFTPDMRQAILEGKKTQTRRPMKEGERMRQKESAFGGHESVAVLTAGGRIKWAIGRDYAVPYGRGKHGAWFKQKLGELPYTQFKQYQKVSAEKGLDPSVLLLKHGYSQFRVKVTGIRGEAVEDITLADAQAEGFDDEIAFWWKICDLYKKHLKKYIAGASSVDTARAVMRDWGFPKMWVVTFELM